VEAHYHYERWGASAKAAQLAEIYSELELVMVASEPRQTRRLTATRTRTLAAGTAAGGDAGLDMMSAIRAAQAIASELELDRLIERLLRIVVENAGARRGFLILTQGTSLLVSASVHVDPDRIELGLNEALIGSSRLPVSVIQYVARSKESVVLDDAGRDQRFAKDPYLVANATQSLLGLPLFHQGELSAILYLENAAVAGVFHAGRLERLNFLGAHAAVAIANAKLYGQVQAARRSLQEANDTLEQKVRERTAALSQRNADLRRVLDTVKQGLLSIDLKGKIAVERSLAAERWFGPFAPGADFAEHMRRFDPGFADWFELSFQSVLDGGLSLELALAQLPTQLSHGGRDYRCEYSPIRGLTELSGLLVVISDETDALAFAREEAAQKELLALCQAFARDRSGVLGFFAEGRDMFEQMLSPDPEVTTLKRHLHTLKGNAAMLGFSLLSSRCHAAEDALSQGSSTTEAVAPVQERWQALGETLERLLGRNGRESLEVSRSELQRLIADAEGGLPVGQVLDQLRRLGLEPLERSLGRLAEHAASLCERLGKGSLQIETMDAGLLADPEQSRLLWLSLVHVIRNAVDHAFEAPEARARLGKPEQNRLRLEAGLDGDWLQIQVADDGRGIDWVRVRALAETRGLPCQTRPDLVRALLAPELSTRTEVTETSGRGVGLCSLERDLRTLGGTVGVESEPGLGTTWTIRVPAQRLGAVAPAPASQRRPRHSQPPRRAQTGS
jgi:GAF domain-containing protein/HPt (histidine-containing phosphotransfer) domain-containing protein